jgi:DNA-binding transcriptional MerR regulator
MMIETPGPALDTAARAARAGKSQTAFRTISEVADELEVAQHVLRFWESKFSQVRPLKRGGGRRYYRPEDVELLRQIRSLLYDEGYTIKGAQKLLRARRARPAAAPVEPAPAREAPPEPARPPAAAAEPAPARALTPELARRLMDLARELTVLRERLASARGRAAPGGGGAA